MKAESEGKTDLPTAGRRPWSTSELRYLRQHRGEGAKAIALALGRTEHAVYHMANKHKIRLRGGEPGGICPRCATYRVALHSEAGRFGLCVACYEKEKSAARRQAAAEEDAHREYEREKKAAQRRRA